MDASVAIALVFALDSDKPPGKRRKWSKDWFLKRETYWHVNLLQEIRVNQPEDFRNFLRMDAPWFDELLSLVEPLIRKEDNVMCPSITPSERLSITKFDDSSKNIKQIWSIKILLQIFFLTSKRPTHTQILHQNFDIKILIQYFDVYFEHVCPYMFKISVKIL